MFGNMWLCLHGSHSDVTGLLTVCSLVLTPRRVHNHSLFFLSCPLSGPQWQGSVNVLNALVPETLKDADSSVTPIFTFNFGHNPYLSVWVGVFAGSGRGPAGQAAGPRVPCGSTTRMGFVRVSSRVGSDDL